MSAVSNRLIPASRAASTTPVVADSSMRPPKLLHPRPTADASRAPMDRVCIRPAWPSRRVPVSRDGSAQTVERDLLCRGVVGLVRMGARRGAEEEGARHLVSRDLGAAMLLEAVERELRRIR